MAGLYITLEPSDAKRLESVANYMRHGNESLASWTGAISYVWLGHDCPDRYAPAVDPGTGVHVISGGRLVYSPADWQRASQLPFSGGLANRLVLEKYLKGGVDAVTPFNGAACIVVFDPRDNTLQLWTDQFGYYPAFVYQNGDSLPRVITTFPDAIRSDQKLTVELDEVSLAEFLRAWRITPPHTYYKNLSSVTAARRCTWDLHTGKSTCLDYWRPFQSGFYSSVNDAAEDLAAALKVAVHERTAAAKKICLFVSGGSDSRVMLFGADDPSKIVGINMYETEPTTESKISKALCDRVGARYIGYARDNDYYPRLLADNVRWSGAMWSAEDSHYLGVKSIVDSEGSDLVMTACTTDWVFKGYGLEKSYRQFLGRSLPLKTFLPHRQDSFLPNVAKPAPPHYADAINQRFSDWFQGCPTDLREDIDYLRVEDRRIRPASYTVSVSGQMMYRIYPYSTFLADSRVAECYSRIPARMKLNGEIWGQAAALVCKGAGDIVDSNFGWSVNASTMQKLSAFTKGWISRRLPQRKTAEVAQQATNHPPCYASWPEYGWYALHSPTVKRLWSDAPEFTRTHLTRAMGRDPWAIPLEQWSQTPLDFMRVLTLIEFLNCIDPEYRN